MARRARKFARAIFTRALAVFATLFAIAFSNRAAVADEPITRQLSIEQRVELVRRSFAEEEARHGSAISENDASEPPARTAQWSNWPNWSNWRNWNNWNNWVNWWN